MLVIVTGGGTGGHVMPAIAIRDAFIKKGVKVIYIGSVNGIESKIVDSYNKNIFLNLRGVKGKSFLKAVEGILLTIMAFFKLFFFFIKMRPHAVVATGGFVCFPASAAGFLTGAKIYLQEQNAVPGATVKLLSKIAKTIFLGFEDAKAFLPAEKVMYSGNPLRQEYLVEKRNYSPHKKGEKMKILILGGSQGARFINQLIVESLSYLDNKKYYFYHQTGESDRLKIETIYREKEIDAKVIGFTKEIHTYYQDTHLIIARAGAMTVSEIVATLRPSILIPFPYAIYDHQTKNAMTLADIKAAQLFTEKEIDAEKLARLLNELYDNPEKLDSMARNLSLIEFKDAACFITEKIMEDINCIKEI